MSKIHEEQSLERLISKCAVTNNCRECENNSHCSIQSLLTVSDKDFEVYLEMTKQGMQAVNSENQIDEVEKCIDSLRAKRAIVLEINRNNNFYDV